MVTTHGMDLRLPASALAAARVAFGAGLILAPTPFASVWIGSPARDRRVHALCRGFGMRDLVLGAGALLSLQRADVGRPRWWFAAAALADTTDLLATLAAGRALPRGRRRFVAGVAAGSAVIGAAAAVSDVDADSARGTPALA